MPDTQPQIVLNLVGLNLAGLAHAPRLRALAQAGSIARLTEVLPAVTCTAQTSMLTGQLPSAHGIVGNGWLFRDTMEVRFWQQSNRLLQSEPLYQTAARRSGKRPFRCAKLFWWFNQGAPVAISVTPKPYYGADGNKAFGIEANPPGLAGALEKSLGRFPFPSFWGPRAGLPCTQWIAHAATKILADEKPDLTLVYLPHLDYAPQRLGLDRCGMPQLVKELDEAVEPILDEAARQGAAVWIVNEYTHVPVDQAIEPNRALRRAGLLSVRPGPFGETLDLYASQAFAVCDHQLAHIYVKDWGYVERVHELIAALPGVAAVATGDDRKEWGLDHSRSGEIIALANTNAWFAYPFWLDDRSAPDYARTVDIHRKPGYDPCELFLDPTILWPTGRVLARLLQKKLGFRTLFDVIPLDPKQVRGSHGLQVANPEQRPILIAPGIRHAPETLPMTGVRDLILNSLGLGD